MKAETQPSIIVHFIPDILTESVEDCRMSWKRTVPFQLNKLPLSENTLCQVLLVFLDKKYENAKILQIDITTCTSDLKSTYDMFPTLKREAWWFRFPIIHF